MKHLNLTIIALLTCFATFGQAPITGPSILCVGSSGTMFDATTGGTWSCSPTTILTISSTTGVATGLTAGVATITYTAGTYVTYSVTVEPLPSPISCPSSVCVGGSFTPVITPTGGTWSTSTPGLLSISMITGAITGVGAGSGVITYTTPAGCSLTIAITVNPAPSAITGPSTICMGGTATYTDLGGGVWSSAAPAVATIGPATGIATGMVPGAVNLIYTLPTSCAATMPVTVVSAPAAYNVTGGGSYCTGGAGSSVSLSGSSTGVSYQLYNAGVAVGSPVAGTGFALSFGIFTAAGTYTAVANPGTSCATAMTGSAIITVSPLPTIHTVTGGGPYCAGGSGDDLGLDGSDAGINYQLYMGGASIGIPMVGTGSALDFGLFAAIGTYNVVAIDPVTGCTNTMSGSAVVSTTSIVVPTVSLSVAPGTTVCAGTTVTFTPSPTGGGTSPTYTWTVGGLAVASGSTYSYVPSSGDVVGVTMTSSALCASPATASGSVAMTVDVPAITATATSAACGGAVTLSSGGGMSYSWSPTTGLTCPGCATNTFVPAATTVYSVTGTDGSGCTGTASVTVDGNSISGYISYTGTPSAGDFKVWLIHFNPSDSSIIATDSTANCVTGGMPYYEFMDEPAGSYLIKAKLNSSVPGTTGYIPTYGLSSPTWDTATTVTHTAGADTMHINMIYGTVPAGPGFISGFVYAGAGKNTSTEAPAANLTIYLKNAAGHIVTYVITGTDGSYKFSGIAEGTYYIYPETYKYYTTPSAVITLSPGSDTATAINFKQHTSFGTITPYNFTKVPQITGTESSFSLYPNPTIGNMNVAWNNQLTGNATLHITDMTGREVYTSPLDINKPSGEAAFSLSNLNDGIYIVTIQSDKFFYSGRLVKISN